MPKPPAGLSFDLDNLWSYLKTHGDSGWDAYPTYFDRLIPRVLDLLDRERLKITFFIVGQDAVLGKNKTALREITARGHDVGNHSFRHEPWLSRYTADEMRREISEAELAIEDLTGRKSRGFRGPGFSWSPGLIEILAERGYLYDATTFPTYLGPLGRLYYFAKSRFSAPDKAKRKDLFGGIRDGLRPVRPYVWLTPSKRKILEIPVTTVPGFKIPLHLSYLLYLSRFSPDLADLYLRTAVRMCRLTRTGLSFLLHPLDFLGGDEVPELAFFPGMDLPRDHKLLFFQRAVRTISAGFEIVDMMRYAEAVLNQKKPLSVFGLLTGPDTSS